MMKCGGGMTISSLINLNRIWKKLALGAIITVLFTMFITNLFIQKINEYDTFKAFEADLESMVNVAAYSLEEPLWNLNTDTLVSICDSFFQKESVSQIIVMDHSLGIMYERKLDDIPHHENFLVTTEKDILHNGKKIGSIHFTMTRYFIDQQNKRNSQIHFIEMLILIFILTTMLVMIISRITKPLFVLKTAFEQVSESHDDIMPQVRIKGNDEFAELSNSFNIMSRNIVDARNSISKLNEELENKVALRTNELNLKNQELNDSLEILTETQHELIDSNQNLQKTLKELQEIQDLLIESGKMALLGELVAGIAHEINTPVGVSLTVSSFIEKELKKMLDKVNSNTLSRKDFIKTLTSLQESSGSVVRNLLRAGELITSFKQVAVDQTSHAVRKFNFYDYVDEIILNLKSQFKNRKIELKNICPEELIVVSYPGAYSQILTNLIMNSLIHAFDEDDVGKITINAEHVDDTLKITFQDNGHGIPEEHVKKIFNPFFTTKRGYGGSGLGLNLAFNITTNVLKGNIICQSELNIGTTFIMSVPYHHPDINEELY
ncbi:MAG: HAMP domain-containing protein [Clostridiales bacterium]|nr:HAMP domain-containing protein [Clostridiales bacterium]